MILRYIFKNSDLIYSEVGPWYQYLSFPGESVKLGENNCSDHKFMHFLVVNGEPVKGSLNYLQKSFFKYIFKYIIKKSNNAIKVSFHFKFF